jgi:hypothetical protein
MPFRLRESFDAMEHFGTATIAGAFGALAKIDTTLDAER